MLRPTLFAVSLFAVLSAGCGKPTTTTTEAPAAPPATTPAATPVPVAVMLGEPVATLQVMDLHRAFASNEVLADENYRGKTVVIYAVLSDIEKRAEGPAVKCRYYGSYSNPVPVCAIAYLSPAGVEDVKVQGTGIAKITGRVVGRVKSAAFDVQDGLYVKLDNCRYELVRELPGELRPEEKAKKSPVNRPKKK